MKIGLGILRFLGFVFFTAIMILIAVMASLIFGTNILRSMSLRRKWARMMVFLLGVKIEFKGIIPRSPGLLVSNHRSYFDIIPVFYHVFVYPVGKIQIDGWPLIGYGARQTGVLFVDREDKDQRKTILDGMREKIAEGFFVINYPEGTTHKQKTTIDFKAGAFQMAVAEGYMVYPVAIDYRQKDDAWVDDDTFIRHFVECFSKRITEVKISYGKPITNKDPHRLMEQVKNWIDEQLIQFQKEWSD